MNADREAYRDLFGDEYPQDYRGNDTSRITSAIVGLVILIFGFAYTGARTLDYDLLSIPELLWNCFVYIVPTRLLNFLDQASSGQADQRGLLRTHAVKSEMMRRILGLDSGGFMGSVAQASRRRLSTLPGLNLVSQDESRPAGLGNWDNSCYQNSVLQGLASLDSLPKYLDISKNASTRPTDCLDDVLHPPNSETADSLRALMQRLNDASNNGKRLWTPASLKSMSSWQQQDAQEYYSKVLDEVDKEIAKSADAVTSGAQELTVSDNQRGFNTRPETVIRNPLEGLLAQRVGCLRCGFAEGLSMIPFNCVTVPLGRDYSFDISTCLDEYAKLESIEGVECGKCTLLKMPRLLNTVLDRIKDSPDDNPVRQSTLERLAVVDEALEDDNYDDKTLSQRCNIPAKNRVSTVKSRQAVIARPPKSLVIHINRSLFDEATGELRKNYAEVRFPKQLDLGPWCLGSSGIETSMDREEWLLDPARSMIAGKIGESRITGPIYELRAVVTHFGRHENGHYVAYRKHKANSGEKTWWRFSDDDVSKVNEASVLDQGGVFMLFYDCIESSFTNLQRASHPGPNVIDVNPVEAVEEEAGKTASHSVHQSLIKGDQPAVTLEPSLRGQPKVETAMKQDPSLCIDEEIAQELESSTASMSEEEDVRISEDYQPTRSILLPRVKTALYDDIGARKSGVEPLGSNVVMV